MAEKQEYGVFIAHHQSDIPNTDEIQIHELSGDALAEATLKQNPKMWTKRMFKVSPFYWL
jgi:hypothetical protein